MEQIQFVRVKVRYVGGRIDPACYEDAVRAHATQGWRLVQIFIENPAAVADEYVLVMAKTE